MVMKNDIREKIENGEISDRLSRQKYNRHVEGTGEFADYVAKQERLGKSRPSKLYLSFDEAQEILRLHAGTGNAHGGVSNVEFINLDKIVGVYEDKGRYISSRRLQIIYGKRSSHLFPVKELG
ncbi:MAG: hypothetical protein LBE35_03155 [Clostridiales bacterium]|jgi:hypothetical protein|nr:hypothetical protein [Clostridiales bacterium]